MLTRRNAASLGLETLRLLFRRTHHARFLQSRKPSLQASPGSSICHLQDSEESYAECPGIQKGRAASHFEFTSAAASSKLSPNPETSRPTVSFRNSEPKFPSFIRSGFRLLESGRFPPYHNVKENDKLSGSGRHFACLSHSRLEDESARDATQDGEHAGSRDAGASETWHTKLSAILATDLLSSSGASIAAETASAAGITATVPEQEQRPSGGTPTDLRSRPTTSEVCQRLRYEKDIDVAWKYFSWVGGQEGYKHGNEAYKTVIQSLCAAKRFSSVFDLLETIRAQGLSLGCIICVKIMKSLANERMFDEALDFFKTVGSYGCKPNVLVYNSYLDILVKAGKYDLAEATFASMAHGGISLDAYTYNIVMTGFRKANQVEKALGLYEGMKQSGCTPNVTTYNTMIHVLQKAGRTEDVLAIFCEMAEKDIVPSGFAYGRLLQIFRNDSEGRSGIHKPQNHVSRTKLEIPISEADLHRKLVWSLCKEKDIASALRCLREMESQGHTVSLATYNLLLVFLGHARKSYAVLELFRDMKTNNCVPNAVTYETAIAAACRAHKAEEAFLLQKEMLGKGLAVEVGTWNMLVTVASKTGQVEKAFELFSEMQQTFKPDLYTYNTLIFSLCKLERGTDVRACLNKAGITLDGIITADQGALELFRHMKEMMAPNSRTYYTLVHGLCRPGGEQDCQELLLEMLENGFHPGVRLCNKVLDVLAGARKVDKAWELFLKMQSNNLPDSNTYTTLIKILAKAGSFGKASKLLQEMERKGFEPCIVTYTSLIDGLAKRKRFFEADKLLQHMARRGCYLDTDALNRLVYTYCKAGQVAKAYRTFEESIDKGCLPDTCTYTSLIQGYFRSGNTNDALEMYNVMKRMGCKPDGLTYNAVLNGLGKAGRTDELELILEEISQLGVASTGVNGSCLDRALSLTHGCTENFEVTV